MAMQPLDMTIIQTPGRGLPYKKDGGARRKFWKKALRYQDPAWWAWLVIIFCHIFAAQYPKRYSKSSHCGPFETVFSTPKGAMHTPSLLYGSPPPPPPHSHPTLPPPNQIFHPQKVNAPPPPSLRGAPPPPGFNQSHAPAEQIFQASMQMGLWVLALHWQPFVLFISRNICLEEDVHGVLQQD